MPVFSLYPCGMLEIIDDYVLACSPDATCLINMIKLPTTSTFSTVLSVPSDNGPIGIGVVEIRAEVYGTSLAAYMSLSTPDFVTCTVGSYTLRQYIPKKHAGQLLQKKLVLKVNLCMYVDSFETGILYKVIVFFCDDT